MTRVNGLILCVALALGGCNGCEDPDAAPAATSASGAGAGAGTGTPREPPVRTRGVTEDGEEIIFAGRPLEDRRRTPEQEARLIRVPTTPDPLGGAFTLEQAVEGMPVDGTLVAEIGTDFGTIFCDLFADRTPRAVATFIGLARGRRPWWDASAGSWRHVPYYRGLSFHRVIPDFVVQGGDYLDDGTGTVGFTIPFEHDETLSHDRAGRLALATIDGPDSGGAQFYITDGPAPQLDGTATIFGQCRPEGVIHQLARVAQSGAPENRPLSRLHIARVLIQRVEGGAAQARMTMPELPEGEPAVGRGASPDPSEMRSLDSLRRRRSEAAEALRREAEGLHEGHGH